MLKILIPLAGFGTRMRPHTWSRPKALLQVAGNTVLGHLISLLLPLVNQETEFVFVVGYKGDEIEVWLRETYPDLTMHFVVQEEALGQAHALWLCREHLANGSALIAFGDGIVQADYSNLADDSVDVVMLVQEVEDPRKFGVVATDAAGYVTQLIEKPPTMEHKRAIAGIHWFREAAVLREALDRVIAERRMTKGEFYLADAYQILLEGGRRVLTKPTTYWLDAGNPENILATNEALLNYGHATMAAIERSYGEDFTVLPPVYLHETAEVYGSVIGPYATIGAGVAIRGSVVRNSILDAGAQVEDVVLDGALLGENAVLQGKGKEMFVGDNGRIEL